MQDVRRAALVTLLAIFAVVAACTDLPTTPRASFPEPPAPLLSDLTHEPDDRVEVLRRVEPLAEDVVVTETIGPLGGVISVPTAGFELTIPPSAVSTPTAITVIAPAGDLVGYHFLPEGLLFAAPLVAVQDLSGTAAALSEQDIGTTLVAAYVDGELSPTMQALELLSLEVSGGSGAFPIAHFSGYVVATN